MRRGLTLFTRVRRNMKSLSLSLQDKALLNARNMAETIIGHIKEFSSLNLSKHRSAINAFVHIIAAITAYQINPFKPKLNLQPRYPAILNLHERIENKLFLDRTRKDSNFKHPHIFATLFQIEKCCPLSARNNSLKKPLIGVMIAPSGSIAPL